ncbi:NXPE family member 1-like [Ptychodera flava]|uniref:NXPE family member 1-like n=1 Tax=Ptychodera flava TaxID=63121 RepID=UPI003969F22C
MGLFQTNLSKILRPTLLVVFGMAVGTYMYIVLIEKGAYINAYAPRVALNNNTIDRAAANQHEQSSEGKADVALLQAHDVKFPYYAFNRFGMGWMGIVEEYEWSYNHLQRERVSQQKYEALMAGPDSISPTSISHSKVYLQEKKSTFKRGDFIHVIVETKDEYGNQRLRGGDFIAGVMFNNQMKTSTAGRSIDYGNGTYSVYFYAGWKGQASIDVSLSFTREGILLYDLTKYRDRRILWSANFTDGKVIEESNCTIANEGTWDNKCSYKNTWALGKTVFLCDKPKSLPCSALTNISQNLHQMEALAKQDLMDKKYLFDSLGKYRKAIFSTCPIKVNIEDFHKPLDIPVCGPDLPIPLSSGYWKNNHTFVSFVCRSQDWTPEQRFKCATDKLFFFTGDSTTDGQFGMVFTDREIMGGRVPTQKKFVALRAGHPIQSLEKIMFESDFIDTINSSMCAAHIPVVFFNYCFHYGQWSIRAYLDRVYQMKLSIIRLFERCPTAVVIAKLGHPRDNSDAIQSQHSGNYLYYDMNRMLRRVLGGIGVHFLDVWDMVAAHPDDNTVHVGRHIIIQQMNMMFSHICPQMVNSN